MKDNSLALFFECTLMEEYSAPNEKAPIRK